MLQLEIQYYVDVKILALALAELRRIRNDVSARDVQELSREVIDTQFELKSTKN